jgi:ArsR family metal-binding transcriptional regulator
MNISDDFQIGPDGAYEATNEVLTIQYQKQLIGLYEQQIMDLTMMSKIELGDDVIEEIKRLKTLLNENK